MSIGAQSMSEAAIAAQAQTSTKRPPRTRETIARADSQAQPEAR